MKVISFGILGSWVLFVCAVMLTDCGECFDRGGTPVRNWWGGYECLERQ